MAEALFLFTGVVRGYRVLIESEQGEIDITNSAGEKKVTLTWDKIDMYHKALPKAVQHFLLYESATCWDVRGVYSAYRAMSKTYRGERLAEWMISWLKDADRAAALKLYGPDFPDTRR